MAYVVSERKIVNNIIADMVAEHAQNELAAEDAKRAAEAELEREKLVKYHWAIKTLCSIGALTDTEIDALFADAAVEIKNKDLETEEVLLRSVTVEGLCLKMYPRLSGSDSARIFTGGFGVHQSADIFDPLHRALALKVVARAVKINRDAEASARFAENMRGQS